MGGICRETKDVFLAVFPESRRDAETLLDIIERHVNNKVVKTVVYQNR